MSTVVLTRDVPALAGVEDMMFGERFHDRVQAVAWPDSVVCLKFGYYIDQGISTEINGLVAVNNSPLGAFLTNV